MTGGGCKAWILPLGEGRHAAIGEYEMVHIVPEWVRLQSIPRCPVYCHKVFTWQGELIPVFDLKAWLRRQDSAGPAQVMTPIICVVAYEDAGRKVGYGGLLLNALPFRTEVTDDRICAFPDDDERWGAIAVSCFFDPAGGPSPVLDLRQIFCPSP